MQSKAGAGHFHASLLVELVDSRLKSTEDQQALLDSIHEIVKRANASQTPFAAIIKEHIGFTKPDMPFAQIDKNIVKMCMTDVLFEKAVE
jgi:hypothetical protein